MAAAATAASAGCVRTGMALGAPPVHITGITTVGEGEVGLVGEGEGVVSVVVTEVVVEEGISNHRNGDDENCEKSI